MNPVGKDISGDVYTVPFLLGIENEISLKTPYYVT